MLPKQSAKAHFFGQNLNAIDKKLLDKKTQDLGFKNKYPNHKAFNKVEKKKKKK